MKIIAKFPRDYKQTIQLVISQSRAPLYVFDGQFDPDCYVYLKPGHSNAELALTIGEFNHLLYLVTKGKYGKPCSG
jgi:hypothetical protein